MGTIKIRELSDLRLYAFTALRVRCMRVLEMSIDEFSLFTILLAEFLYLESAPSGEKRNVVYMVFADTVKQHYIDSEYSGLAYQVVRLRNKLCHTFGSPDTENELFTLYSDRDYVLEFCKYLGLYS